MPQSCKVCDSPYKDEIDKLIVSGQFAKSSDIYRFLKDKYGDKFILNEQNVRRHRRRFLDKIQDNAESDRIRNQAIQNMISRDVEAVEMLQKSLSTLGKQLKKIESNVNDPVERKEVRDIIGSLAKVTELLLRYSDKIKKEPTISEEDIFDRILECILDFPVDYQTQFVKKWRELEKS